MTPKIIGVKQTTKLGPNSIPVQVLNVTWTAGTYGPFTAESSWDELNNGTLMTKLQAMALALNNLPTA